MKKRIIIEGITLAYIELNPNQPNTLFFIHGNSSSCKTWENILYNDLLSGYRLIAFDLPGHGESSASPNPDNHYGISDLGRILGKATESLINNENYILIGCSLGTNIVSETLLYINPKGIVLESPCIIGENLDFSKISFPDVDTSVLFIEDPAIDQVKKYYSYSILNKKEEVIDSLVEDFLKVKPPFRSAMLQQSTSGGKISDEIKLLKEYQNPLLLITGKEDKVINPDYLDSVDLNKWKNSIFKIPGAGHPVHLDEPEIASKLIYEYSTEILK